MKATTTLTQQEIQNYIGQKFDFTTSDGTLKPIELVNYCINTKKFDAVTKDGEVITIDLFIVHGLLQLI